MPVTEAATPAERLIRIGEVARGAGVSVRAVRYYEQQGL
ncbi:MerR family DNA-binding transcriptional regulator, partial [Streptomyces sp. SID6648]|nr:MerR family DNA-binding transcriptional regulator [Streptomyces sp. SID6648]